MREQSESWDSFPQKIKTVWMEIARPVTIAALLPCIERIQEIHYDVPTDASAAQVQARLLG